MITYFSRVYRCRVWCIGIVHCQMKHRAIQRTSFSKKIFIEKFKFLLFLKEKKIRTFVNF